MFVVTPVVCPAGYVLTASPDDGATFYCQCDFTNLKIVDCSGTAIIIKVRIEHVHTQLIIIGSLKTLSVYLIGWTVGHC